MTDILKVMEHNQLCSEHAARCFIEAKRRVRAKQKASEQSEREIARQKAEGGRECRR
jgi:hypothetical protein